MLFLNVARQNLSAVVLNTVQQRFLMMRRTDVSQILFMQMKQSTVFQDLRYAFLPGFS